MIDLHTHTDASDGTDSPAELIARAAAAGIEAVALTDHDTTAGWDEAETAVNSLGHRFTLIRGTEFSCVHADESRPDKIRPDEIRPDEIRPDESRPDGNRSGGTRVRPLSVHLLGYLYDPNFADLKAERAKLRTSRLGRGKAIVTNLEQAGYPISWAQVTRIAGTGAIGRPHIGAALVEAGVVSDVGAAFRGLLSSDSPHYVDKQDLPLLDGIRLIRAAGGVPVLAHPWARSRGRVLSEQQLRELVAAGLLGLEADHPDHSTADRIRLHELATELDVLATGSSDYHGRNKQTPLAADTTSPEMLERLVDLATGIPPIFHSVA